MTSITAPATEAVIYARFSPRRNAAQSMSIETQMIYCHQYCNQHNLEVVGEEFDEAVSGKDHANRPGFRRAIALACEKRAVLVVYSLSRFARSTVDAIHFAERLNRSGAQLASLHEQIDTNTPMGRFFFTVFAALAALEREQVSERTREAMQAHQSAGLRMSAAPPYGWMVDPENTSRLIHQRDEQQTIRLILAEFKAGSTPYQIARKLDARGQTPRGKRWYPQTVERIIKAAEKSGQAIL